LVEGRRPDAGDHELLVIRLLEEEQRDVFLRLCLDVVSATAQAATEPEAVERFIARTWRWHRLLAGGRDGRLSDEEQKGLLGELAVLSRILIPAIGAAHAVRCWRGPLGAPKDFEVGRICIEAKARRGTALPHVAISSELQLDATGCDALFLHVAEVSAAADDVRAAVTLTEACEAVRSLVLAQEPAFVDLLEERFAAAGFDWDDDYSDARWIPGPEHLFQVEGAFPRVTPDMFPHGVSGLRYVIALADCEPYRRDVPELTALISGGPHGSVP
jgi:hypothetical protein